MHCVNAKVINWLRNPTEPKRHVGRQSDGQTDRRRDRQTSAYSNLVHPSIHRWIVRNCIEIQLSVGYHVCARIRTLPRFEIISIWNAFWKRFSFFRFYGFQQKLNNEENPRQTEKITYECSERPTALPVACLPSGQATIAYHSMNFC